MKIQKTEKVKGVHHTYRKTAKVSPTNCKKFAGSYVQLLKHKNNVRAVLLRDRNQKEFHTIQVISPSEARIMIGWLARYIAISDPDPISLAIASTKAHANGIRRDQDTIAAQLGLENNQ